MICLPQVDASLPTKGTRLHGKPHLSALSCIRQLALPEASFKNNNGLSNLIHCIVCKLRVPAYLPARLPQRQTGANGHPLVCTPTLPTQYPRRVPPATFPPRGVRCYPD